MWTVSLKHIPLCSLIVQKKGKQLPIKTSELSRQRRKTSQNNSSSNNKRICFPSACKCGEQWREQSANQERCRIWSGAEKILLLFSFFFLFFVPQTAPHFYALSWGKQTEPCSAGTWLVLPPLLWIIWRAVSTRGMEAALTAVDFTSSNSTSANALEKCLNGPLKCVALQRVASCFTYLHHQNHFSDDCEYNVMLMWCFLPPTWFLLLV